jgi:hypothetical protein
VVGARNHDVAWLSSTTRLASPPLQFLRALTVVIGSETSCHKACNYGQFSGVLGNLSLAIVRWRLNP